MQNATLKRDLVNNGLYDKYRERRQELYKANLGFESINLEEPSLYKDILDNESIKACNQLYRARKEQKHKVEKWLNWYIVQDKYKVIFATFTFNDSTLKLTPLYRRKTLVNVLNSFCIDACFNIDYGHENNREHYHALCVLDNETYQTIDFKPHYSNDWEHLNIYLKYGFYSLSKCSFDSPNLDDHLDDVTKLASYCAKLQNHSVKVKQTKMGYLKGTPYQLAQKHNDYGILKHRIGTSLND